MHEQSAVRLIQCCRSMEELAAVWTEHIDDWKNQFDYSQLVELVALKNDKKQTLAVKESIDQSHSEPSPANVPTTPNRTWADIPALEMLPAGRRKEAVQIIRKHPEAVKILERCKMDLIDCYTAMELLGMPEPYNPFEQSTQIESNGGESCRILI
jgi:hypothetical protein